MDVLESRFVLRLFPKRRPEFSTLRFPRSRLAKGWHDCDTRFLTKFYPDSGDRDR